MSFLFQIFQPNMLSQPFMVNAFLSGSIVAVLAAIVGFFVILRGYTFAAHALPKIGFAGASGAVMFGVNPLIGLVVFAVSGALSIGLLGKRGRHDVITALVLVVALGTGALFLVITDNYATGAYALLFGQLVGVSGSEVVEIAILGVICIGVLSFLYRPLLFASILQEGAEARGISIRLLGMVFLVVVGITTAITVPVVGALLSFSLMIGPAATTQYVTHHPFRSMGLSVSISLFTVWSALTLAYDTGWPIGFFVAAISAIIYCLARFTAKRNPITFVRSQMKPKNL
ncbi:metal ABC transporter permease [Shimazuella sp. AN120528]|uniref:metal ABC transporter permease n=1 Tax=Shimazuella soli TaxID=1892854 RepID=UPI001F110E41|nr:metal ABC transporter permease [Shimazuella soli]MCH5586379.1 metal ABC transporter permease [Shimazuella soli]